MFIFKLSPVSFRFFLYWRGGGSVYALKELIAFFLWTTQPNVYLKTMHVYQGRKRNKVYYHISYKIILRYA